jgi:threonyl-tRNA synthetase
LQKVPFLLVVGDKEVESGTVSVRGRGGNDLGSLTIEAVETLLEEAIAKRGRLE